MAQGIVYQNKDGEIISANPAAEKLLGISLDQMKGRKSIDKRWKAIREDGSDFPGEEHPSMIALKTAKEVKGVIMGVYHPEKEDHVWLLINAQPMFEESSSIPFQVFVTFEDITTIKSQEAAIKNENEKFYRILEYSPIGKLVLDKIGNITYANKQAEKILGVDKALIIHRKYKDKVWNSKDEEGNKIPAAKFPFRLIVDRKENINDYFMVIENAAGQEINILVHGSPLLNSDEQVEGAIMSIMSTKAFNKDSMKTWKDF